MRERILANATIFTAMLLPTLGGVALAGPEWCDDGSPPPNDWRFRKTGAQSDVSRKEWLRSTTSGELVLDVKNTLEGGVATGMWEAVTHAPSQEEVSARRERDRDRDNDQD